jgi:hypothetical protein
LKALFKVIGFRSFNPTWLEAVYPAKVTDPACNIFLVVDMQSDFEPILGVVSAIELIQALDVVVNLAEGNCLETTDPLIASDPALLLEAHCQLRALETVNAFLIRLAAKPIAQA